MPKTIIQQNPYSNGSNGMGRDSNESHPNY